MLNFISTALSWQQKVFFLLFYFFMKTNKKKEKIVYELSTHILSHIFVTF